MKKTTLFAGFVLAMGMLCACTQEEMETEKETPCQSVTVEKASENALKFVKEFNGQTRGGDNLEVESVVAVGMANDGGMLTRAGDEQKTAYYAVNMKGNNGYVLAAADERFTPVFAYVPEGSYDDDAIENNQGLKYYLGSLMERIANDDETLLRSNARLLPTSVAPLLQTAWGPGAPYNIHATNTHHATGIGIALAQICAYYEHPDTLNWSGYIIPLDWAGIMSECGSNNGTLLNNSTYGSSVSWLCMYVGDQVDSYTPQSANMFLYRMSAMGYDYVGYMYGTLVDDDWGILEALENGRPTFARGYSSVSSSGLNYSGGGAWVIDGYQSGLYHCNWGHFGHDDGYFAMDTSASNVIPYQYNTSFIDLGVADSN